MAKLLKLRRGTTAQHNSFTGAEGEVTIDTNKDVAVVHDGSTQGGHALAREDLSGVNVIANTHVASGAAIAGTKISPDFGSQAVTTTGVGTFASLDISGNSDIDGTCEADAYTVDGVALNEYIADTVGAMVSSNTETGITVTYEDGDNTLDFVLGTLNQDTTGTADKATHVTITDNESTNEENLLTFVENAADATGNHGLEMDGDLKYNPSTGTLSATIFKGNVDAVDGDFDGTLEADAITVGGTALNTVIAGVTVANATDAVNAGHVTVADNENTNENNLITFIEDASATGNVGLESDGDFHYNPSTGTVTATKFTSTGDVTVGGNLQVNGTTTTVASSTMTVADKNIEIAKGAANDAAADGAGITVDSGDGDKTWNWVDSTDSWTSSENIDLASGKVIKVAGTQVLSATAYTGTATNATNAAHVSVADNENTNENNLIPFIEDASATGNVGLESDGDFHYNPSTGKLTATTFAGDGSALTGIQGVPTGVVMWYAANSAPTGFVKCNGAAISRSTYSALFAVIGTTYGTGDGSSTFNVPELRGEFVRGWDDSRGVDSGRAIGSTQGEATKTHGHSANSGNSGNHTHNLSGNTSNTGNHSHSVIQLNYSNNNAGVGNKPRTDYRGYQETLNTTNTGAHSHSLSGSAAAGGDHSHNISVSDYSGATETRPRSVALLACIKT